MRHRRSGVLMTRCVRLLPSLLGAVLLACGGTEPDTGVEEARAVPMSQSPAARALRLPRMRPSPSRNPTAADRPVVIRVRVLFSGAAPPDTTVQARSFNPECGETFVDTAVARNGNAVQEAIVWLEGPTEALTADRIAERRPTVRLDLCRLRPRLQLATPGSTLMLVMHDSLAESLVIVPSTPQALVDTVPFTMDGQLVPVQHVADSMGVLAVYAARLPWARAFVAIAPAASSALSDGDGRAQFTVDGRGTTATIRAWHPSLGIVSSKLTISAKRNDYEVTLTFKR
jgi:hypothetical protein